MPNTSGFTTAAAAHDDSDSSTEINSNVTVNYFIFSYATKGVRPRRYRIKITRKPADFCTLSRTIFGPVFRVVLRTRTIRRTIRS